MLAKAEKLLWFTTRPSFYRHAVELVRRQFSADRDSDALRIQATAWAAQRAVSVPEALSTVGLIAHADDPVPALPEAVLAEAEARALQAKVKMGGAGDLSLIHAVASLSKAQKVVETGVALGWSSLAILQALKGRSGAQLVSVDMPYPARGTEHLVGHVVPDALREPWSIIREPDRYGLEKALHQLGNEIDFCHYDSDKSWYGRRYAFPLLWKALRKGGAFISDDIQDNMAFAEFVEEMKQPYAVTEYKGKYVGILRKPL